MFIAYSILFIVLVSGAVYGLWQPAVRISHVQIFGADQALADVALQSMQGTYAGLIPRDSTFFFPASSIRSDISSLHPEIAAVSIFRSGLVGLSIRLNDRAPIARWCGLSPTSAASSVAHGSEEYCYVFDASGYVFAAYGTTSAPINAAKLYAPLEHDSQEPLRATVARAAQLPAAFDFARQISTLGPSVSSIVIRGDEVDDILLSGSRITYVLGREQDAYTALVSARQNLDLLNGSIDYVDLRFDGKVYLKKKE